MVWKSSHLVQYLTIEYIIIIIKIKNKTSYVLRCYIEKLIKLCVQMKCNFLVPALNLFLSDRNHGTIKQANNLILILEVMEVGLVSIRE